GSSAEPAFDRLGPILTQDQIMSGFARSRIAVPVAALIAVSVGGALAQTPLKPWPDQQPAQPQQPLRAWPGDARQASAPPVAPMAPMMAPTAPMRGPALGAPPAGATAN